MPIVKVRPKRQLTLPADVADEVGIHIGDYVEIIVEHGRVVIAPKILTDRRHHRLSDLLGAAKGAYATADEADLAIANDRDE